jgi:hypothetical protein
MSSRIEAISRQRAPAPAGKQIAILVLGLAVVGALGWQFMSGLGPGRAVEDARRQSEGAGTVAGEPDEGGTRAPAVPAAAPDGPGGRDFEFEEDGTSGPVPSPGAAIVLPEGLDAGIASRMRLALNALDQPLLLIAEDGARSLPSIVEDAPTEQRPVVRAFVIDRFLTLVRRARLRRPVLDAALALAGQDATGLEALRDATIEYGLEDADAAAVALLFLDALAARGDAVADARIATLAGSGMGPLHVRVLAARLLVARDAVPDGLREAAADPDTPAVLREALGADR